MPRALVSLSSLFSFESARSHGVDDYEAGVVPFVTSTLQNNGVVAYVTPLVGDKVFDGPALSISGLGDATVQLQRFLPKGNGGDSLTICRPRTALTSYELLSVAAAFNTLHAWRFSFGRKCSARRLADLEIPAELPAAEPYWNAESEEITRLAGTIRSLSI